jgi:hypothetical protein
MPVPEQALQALLDKHAIYEVLARYARAIDRRDESLLRSVFHPDAIDHHVGRNAPATQFCTWAMQVLQKLGPTAHYMGFPLVELNGDVAYSECYALAFHRVGEGADAFDDFLGARLLDRFEKRDGEWRIAHRRVVYDWSRDVAVAETWGRGVFGAAIAREARSGPDDPVYAFLGSLA